MSQRVPSCDAEPSTPSGHPRGQQQPSAPHTRMQSPDYEVAELTWKNGHLAMFGHRQPRVGKPIPRYASPASWDKPSAGDTLESLVDQATRAAQSPTPAGYEHGKGISVAALDALVPCSSRRPHGEDHSGCVPDLVSGLSGTCVGSCSGRKRPKVGLWEAKYSASGSAAASMALTFDTCEINGGDEVGFATSANPVEESRETENTSSAKLLTVGEDRVSVCPSMDDGSQSHRDGCDKEEKTITMAKSSRKASVHNQSERKRRDRINQKMETLQKLVPNSSKTDKASMLDEVIEYLKQLQAQVQMMSRMNSSIPHMMMPMHVQQFQLSLMAQMAQMAQMGMGMGMGMGMVDMNSFTRPGNSGMLPFLQPSPFVPFPATWDGSGDRLPTSGGMALPTPAGTVLPDPFSAFMACQTQQPISLEAYNRTASSYQQMFHQLPASNPKS